ncbi:hypothetical protein HDV05_003786 [Chytridiales sp. JEL 0842]|nr:hypothetical protein HDV05_003786 [Chytridiales sp. JEL 0842]
MGDGKQKQYEQLDINLRAKAESQLQSHIYLKETKQASTLQKIEQQNLKNLLPDIDEKVSAANAHQILSSSETLFHDGIKNPSEASVDRFTNDVFNRSAASTNPKTSKFVPHYNLEVAPGKAAVPDFAPTLYAISNVGTAMTVYKVKITPEHIAKLDKGGKLDDSTWSLVRRPIGGGADRTTRKRDGFFQDPALLSVESGVCK